MRFATVASIGVGVISFKTQRAWQALEWWRWCWHSNRCLSICKVNVKKEIAGLTTPKSMSEANRTLIMCLGGAFGGDIFVLLLRNILQICEIVLTCNHVAIRNVYLD